MIRVSVMYPSGNGATFDHDYYLHTHIPMVAERLGDALKSVVVDKGLFGAIPGSPPPYLAVAYLVFDSVEEYQSSMGPHLPQFAADQPNYTNVAPGVQVSEFEG